MSKYKLKDEPKEKDPLDEYMVRKEKLLTEIKFSMQHAFDYLERNGRPQPPEKIMEYVAKYSKKFNQYPTCAKIINYFTPQEIKDKYQKNRSEWIEDPKQLHDSNTMF